MDIEKGGEMTYPEAKNLAEKIIKMVESEGVTYHTMEEKREGNSRYLIVKAEIKIT